jgi:hypothetical protein
VSKGRLILDSKASDRETAEWETQAAAPKPSATASEPKRRFPHPSEAKLPLPPAAPASQRPPAPVFPIDAKRPLPGDDSDATEDDDEDELPGRRLAHVRSSAYFRLQATTAANEGKERTILPSAGPVAPHEQSQPAPNERRAALCINDDPSATEDEDDADDHPSASHSGLQSAPASQVGPSSYTSASVPAGPSQSPSKARAAMDVDPLWHREEAAPSPATRPAPQPVLPRLKKRPKAEDDEEAEAERRRAALGLGQSAGSGGLKKKAKRKGF